MGTVQAEDCKGVASNMAQYRSCLSDQRDQSLQDEYQRTLAFVLGRDAAAASLLEDAQLQWQRYSQASCEYAVAARQAPAGANDARLECRSTFVEARIRILRRYRDDSGQMD
ncbi:lysozyme inhibitor LprI family protein [Flavobacterium sp. MXW15]|nr:lysozyme inhibitor LprI family protein [Flavobacterium sp. MXW15]